MTNDEKFGKWYPCGPFSFRGAEDDVVVSLAYKDNNGFDLSLPVITRARKLLVIITSGEHWQEEKRKENPLKLPLMEEAVAKNLVTRFPCKKMTNFD